jgi:hypothetical protein
MKTKRSLNQKSAFRFITFNIVAVQFLLIATVINHYEVNLAMLKDDPKFSYSTKLGGYLDNRYQNLISSTPPKNFVEDYWGLTSLANRQFYSTKVDSIIHALGNQRQYFRVKLDKQPDVAITLNPQNSLFWYTWDISANWWFYEPLYMRYVPEISSPSTLTWRKSLPTKTTQTSCFANQGGRGVTFISKKNSLYSLVIEYWSSGKNKFRFSMLQNNLNFASGASGFVAIDPSAKSQTFPVLGTSDGLEELKMINVPDSKDQLTQIISCRANEIVTASNMMKSPAGLPILQITDPVTPFPLSDQNWEMGVARNWAGFFVINTKNAKSKFKLGAQILFKDGSLREILKVVESPEYLNIYLEGPILNSTLTGYPNKFQVM